VTVVENMSFFDGADGRRYTPFGAGSGDRIQREFGLPHLIRFPIAEDISQAGDGGSPLALKPHDMLMDPIVQQSGHCHVLTQACLHKGLLPDHFQIT
jgi:NUBPL iron-transfer P-loop NTPase